MNQKPDCGTRPYARRTDAATPLWLAGALLLSACIATMIFPEQTSAQVSGGWKISDTQSAFSGSLQNYGLFGYDVTFARVNYYEDDIPDLVVGNPFDYGGGVIDPRGAVWVIFIDNLGQVTAEQQINDLFGGFMGTLDDGDEFGYAVECLGDLDGDGLEDVAVSTPGDDDGAMDAGAVWILFLNNDGTVKSHQKISATAGAFTGTLNADDRFGGSLANLGDLDGDNVTDLAVGACYDDDGGPENGAVWVLFLNSNGTVKGHQKISETAGGFTGVLSSSAFGFASTAIDDLDGDNVKDLIVGEEGGGSGCGAVWVLFLNSNGTVKGHQEISDTQGGFMGGLNAGDMFGSALSSPGDLDDDGVADVFVGAVNDDDGGSNRGAVWLLFLNSDGTVKAHSKIGDTQGGFTGVLDDDDNLGMGLAVADLGATKTLLVGAPNDDDGGVDKGAVWMLFLGSGPPCHDNNWEPAEYCGHDAMFITGTPEMNHDCYCDFLDLGLWFRGFGLSGPNLSGDFPAVTPGYWDISDLVHLHGALGTSLTPCTPGGAGIDSTGGTLYLTFDPDPAVIDTVRTVSIPSLHTLYVVADDVLDAHSFEYSVELSVEPMAVNRISLGSHDYVWSSGANYHHFVTNVSGWGSPPFAIAEIQILMVPPTVPVRVELKLLPSPPYAGMGMRWTDAPHNRKIDFATFSSTARIEVLPDLHVRSFTSPPEFTSGLTDLSISYVVENLGYDLPAAGFRTSLRASEDVVITEADLLLATVDVAELGALQDTTIALTLSPSTPMPSGDFYLGVMVDDLFVVDETNEANNTAANPIAYIVPEITAITDVENDQGRRVRIEWSRSARDSAESPTPVLQYESFRRIDPLPDISGATPAKTEAIEEHSGTARNWGMISDPQILLEGWDFVGVIPAHQEYEYSVLAETLDDSTVDHGIHYSVFFIRAATSDPGTYFDSSPDSGYSVDNLAPGIPLNFLLSSVDGIDANLAWDENVEPDLRYYTLYRDLDPSFIPSTANRLGYAAVPAFTDEGGAVSYYTYKLSATDFAGNESGYATLGLGTSDAGPGTDLPEVLAFRSATSNPVSARAVVHFDLPSPAPVTLRIFDVRGRIVRQVFAGTPHPAGRHRFEWNLRDERGNRVGPGIYLQRFETPGLMKTVKVVVLH